MAAPVSLTWGREVHHGLPEPAATPVLSDRAVRWVVGTLMATTPAAATAREARTSCPPGPQEPACPKPSSLPQHSTPPDAQVSVRAAVVRAVRPLADAVGRESLAEFEELARHRPSTSMAGPTEPTSSTDRRSGLGLRPQVQGVLAVKEWRTAQYQLAGPVGHPGSLTSAESAYSQPAAPANAGYLVARVRRVVWRVGMGT